MRVTNHVVSAESVSGENPNVLVIYSSENKTIDEHQKMLDMLIGHFTENIRFVSTSEVEKKDIEEVDVVFYYGQRKELLPRMLISTVAKFTGVMVAIGHNVEQFGERFSFIDWRVDSAVIEEVIHTKEIDKQISIVPQSIINIDISRQQQAIAILLGKKKNETHPLLVKYKKDYYFASNLLKQPFSIVFAEALHEVFSTETREDAESPLGYIRLEDIHPLVDPENMMAIANILAEKNIPYMIAVIPVYTNPETKKQYHLSDSPKLLKVLKYMQDNGGSIVLHGYTHQFRLSETGEGFEFWDVEYNMPIYHGPDDAVRVKTKDDFGDEDEYEQFLSEQKAYEREYIEERLTKGIQELANYGLYPLAFEAPHYTMSQYGYEVASEFFSTYVGQLQLSDEDWEIMTTVPYMSKPSFLHGMQLLPETIGYVKPDDSQAIEKMVLNAQDYQFVRDGIVAGFYHPYLGVKLFEELIAELEKFPQINWIDLKQLNHRVQTDYVDIKTKNGEIVVKINHLGLFKSSFDYFGYHMNNILVIILWSVAGIGALAVVNFIYRIISISYRNGRIKRGYSID
ncbi:MAG TPA: polysaccharide deacetylase family protein [Cerasibacillus sp.]|uniref:polysaccharide deacetylase family protein n=1 Tax=Cerasibacillus sp. TaxID=2498711 RepID=UPI002F423F11